jgi:ADP-ribose pyrophosphatase
LEDQPKSKADHTRRIFKGRVVTLDVDTVTLPNGATVELEMIHHPGAAAIVPLREDGTVILIRQFRHAAGGYIYEIPAGKLHPAEDPKLCAARELQEEIGYRATVLELMASVLTTPGFTDEIIHIYVGTGLTKGKQDLDHDEVIEIIELPLEKALAQVKDGTIRDAKTIVGLQMAYLRDRVP